MSRFVPVAPVNETDMVLLPKSLHALKQVAKEVGLDVRGAYWCLAEVCIQPDLWYHKS
jgi:hypothetical protein